ncbi:MAG: alpha/beta hydrolase [Firmicutes bacterium]|nr:alpha/beta hydrolase [Bacillota bacterium]
MSYDVREGVLEFGDHTIDYAVFGKGTKPLLLIRGLNITRLRGTVKALIRRYRTYADNYRIYVIDRREPMPEVVDNEFLAEDVYQGARALGLEHALVMGNSQGGMIAQYFTLNHPEFVEKLVLNVTTSTPNPILTGNVNEWVDIARTGDMTALCDNMMDMLYPPGIVPGQPESDERPANPKTHPPEEFITLAEACLTVNTRDRLGEIKCPVLVLGGGKDIVMSPEASVELAEGLGTEAVIFEDLGHAAYEELEYQELVKEFFDQ